MQVLKRVVGEHFSIGEDITVRVIGVNGSHVRLGIEAPKSVSVHRAEVYDRIKNQHAGRLTIEPLVKR
ncbi:carbon storage regulator CsrA [Pseudomonas sp. CCC3.1]|uniref:carbon storage regulator CsrA n=1 Tax=Pseudomonas sp. CCC3.1 TaxID=3048607 RepID=UPI002AC909A9|nr:carbon storage regulator CsrA [Pseudomonas sp. CCC3.1]MEB0206113.1 carbon storage regulator CsrA [Pseudomonas sp. CCC3.1]WPX38248.1 carbon storage regulator CsrA [Pseudomonas sp. CCC3.1]